MTWEIETNPNGLSRRHVESSSGREWLEYSCAGGCGEWLGEDEVIWARRDGTLDTDTGLAWCDGCLPPEPEEAE